MNPSKKTTLNERLAIVMECIENDSNYSEIAKKYQVSYQQVYSWVKKYRLLGQSGLEDRRGKHPPAASQTGEKASLLNRILDLEKELEKARQERDDLKEQYERLKSVNQPS